MLLLGGCERRPDVGPVVVSAIGNAPRLGASDEPHDFASLQLADSIAQGLVRFDAAGQIEPGIAERWIVTDEGRTYIFRLREAYWPDGKAVTAAEIVTALKRHLAPRSRNSLLPYLSAIESIVEMTPQVIQIELSRPRPDLLKLFAQPELAIVRPRRPGGTGPFRLVGEPGHVTQLVPARDPDPAAEDAVTPTPEDRVVLLSERASAAIARFVARKSDLVVGGTLADWPLVAAAGAAPSNVRLDPAAGLFGLAIVNRAGFLATAENRAAIALAIDRAALTDSFAPRWDAAEDLLPAALDSAAPPARAPWTAIARTERLAAARAQVARWRAAAGATPTVRIALPGGPGGMLLWARVAASLYAVGIRPERAALDDPDSDLRLVDAVAPYDSARWYLSTACQPCSEAATAAIEAARIAPSLIERARAIASADAALAQDVAFVPIARPFRWSLVALRLREWQANDRAWHPLNRLRRDPN